MTLRPFLHPRSTLYGKKIKSEKEEGGEGREALSYLNFRLPFAVFGSRIAKSLSSLIYTVVSEDDDPVGAGVGLKSNP